LWQDQGNSYGKDNKNQLGRSLAGWKVVIGFLTSNDSVSLEIEAKTCSTRKKIKDNMGLKIPYLNLTSQIPIDDHENITRAQVAKENIVADDARKMKREKWEILVNSWISRCWSNNKWNCYWLEYSKSHIKEEQGISTIIERK